MIAPAKSLTKCVLIILVIIIMITTIVIVKLNTIDVDHDVPDSNLSRWNWNPSAFLLHLTPHPIVLHNAYT